jgi:hypothetical protein
LRSIATRAVVCGNLRLQRRIRLQLQDADSTQILPVQRSQAAHRFAVMLFRIRGVHDRPVRRAIEQGRPRIERLALQASLERRAGRRRAQHELSFAIQRIAGILEYAEVPGPVELEAHRGRCGRAERKRHQPGDVLDAAPIERKGAARDLREHGEIADGRHDGDPVDDVVAQKVVVGANFDSDFHLFGGSPGADPLRELTLPCPTVLRPQSQFFARKGHGRQREALVCFVSEQRVPVDTLAFQPAPEVLVDWRVATRIGSASSFQRR